jgi:prepilin-type N-terminal cleavage/methylation domain-containing protein
MNKWAQKQSGFTIVELLIVIVVIAILAAITLVSYNGIRDRAQLASVKSQLSSAATRIEADAALNNDSFPASLADIGIKDSGNITYLYSSDNTVTPKQYCITTTIDYTQSFYVMSNTGSSQQEGVCSGQNLITWYESDPNAPLPLDNANTQKPWDVVTTEKYSGVSSMQIGPTVTGVPLRKVPFSVTPSQVVNVSLWLKTDANWNGGSGNSKIRVGNQTTGSVLRSCPYDGPKTVWTKVTCTYTVPANGSINRLTLSVGNDGSTGNIWIDDINFNITNP